MWDPLLATEVVEFIERLHRPRDMHMACTWHGMHVGVHMGMHRYVHEMRRLGTCMRI